MKKFLCILSIAGFLCGCRQPSSTAAEKSHLYDSSYKPAKFADPQRHEKISQCWAVVDSLYARAARENHFPGLAYGIVVDGELMHKGQFGFTDLDRRTPVSSSSMFRIASMSKSFTAMAILRLRDQGLLQLDDPAEKYIPALKKWRYLSADAPLITIRHLLTHGAGFPEDNPWGDRQLGDTDKEFMDFLQKQPSFSHTPGVAYEYSNLGFALLGKIITTVAGVPYQQYIRENILRPLGMESSCYEYSQVQPDKLAHGYRWINNSWREEALLHDPADGSWGAMGAMITSVDEFSKYMALHLSAWPASNEPEKGPVHRSSLREMQYPWRFNGIASSESQDGCATASAYCYGLRWEQTCKGVTTIMHSGGLPGFGSQWRILPDYGIGVVAFANRTYAGFSAVNTAVLDTIIKLAQLEPRQLPASEILTKRKYELIHLLPNWENATESDIFAENFFSDYPIDSLKKEAITLFQQAGKIVKAGDLKPENQLRGSFVLEGERANLEISFTLSPENPARIQAYRIKLISR